MNGTSAKKIRQSGFTKVVRDRTIPKLDPKNAKEGDIVQGCIKNIVKFGAFIDIGIGKDCLLHKSQIMYVPNFDIP